MPNTSDASRSDILNMLPKRVLTDHTRRRLKTLSDELDQLLFLDELQEVAVDRKALIRFMNNEELVPTSLRDIALVETSKHLGRKVKELGKGHRITWREGEKYGLPIHSLSAEDIRIWGITDRTSTEELIPILKERMPEIPHFWMNDNSKELYESMLKGCMVNRTFWDCLVANLGWWAAITLGGGLFVFFILVGSGVPWPWALLIAGIYQSVATAYFVGQCLANSNFQQ